MIMGLVEVAIYISHYLDALDLTREAARFASIRDPFSGTAKDHDCGDPNNFDFWWDTSCIFSSPDPAFCTAPLTISFPGAENQLDPTYTNPDVVYWCNGLNKYLDFDPETDDIVISAYTIDANDQITQTHPIGPEYVTDTDGNISYYWAFSNHYWAMYDASGAQYYKPVDNWKKSCTDTVDNNKLPYFTRASVAEKMGLTAADYPDYVTVTPPPGSKGFVAVEVYYCHQQALNLPLFTIFVPNPMVIHAYTIMPLPQVAPTATTRP